MPRSPRACVAGYLIKPVEQAELRSALADPRMAHARDSAPPRRSLETAAGRRALAHPPVAEDNSVNQNRGRRVCSSSWGHRVRVVATARAALVALARERSISS